MASLMNRMYKFSRQGNNHAAKVSTISFILASLFWSLVTSWPWPHGINNIAILRYHWNWNMIRLSQRHKAKLHGQAKAGVGNSIVFPLNLRCVRGIKHYHYIRIQREPSLSCLVSIGYQISSHTCCRCLQFSQLPPNLLSCPARITRQ